MRKKNLLSKEKFQMLYWIMMSRQLLFLIQTRPPFLMSLRGSIYFHQRGQKNVPIKGLYDKRQIASTFVVSAAGSFLPIQLIYQGKSKRCLPKFTFPSNFHVTFTPNHWSNLEKCEDLFKVIIVPYLSAKKKELGYPEDQSSLIIMDTFKGQDNEEMKRLLFPPEQTCCPEKAYWWER